MSKYLAITRMVVALLVGATSQMSAAGFPKWPLRNGDFSNSQGWARPTDWDPATNSGKHNFIMEPDPPPFANRPSVAVIETVESGSAYYFQKLSLMKGDYRLSAEVSGTGGAGIQVNVGSGTVAAATEPVTAGTAWTPVQVEAAGLGGDSAVCMLSTATAGAAAKFRYVKLEVKRLESSPVPFVGGGRLGGVVLPDDPTLAEEFACYELQRYIAMMCGLPPGLKGRDEVHEGKLVYLGRAAVQELRGKLRDLPGDSYLTNSDDVSIALAGKTDQGTLYAVYEFLHQQGCRWVVPGDLGEVVPQREALTDCESKIESPDYDARGVMVLSQDFHPGGGEEAGWVGIKVDDYLDWFLRNRLNAIWFGGTETFDFGAHRGHGWVQLLNHSYNCLVAPHGEYFDDHPDWYPLIEGKRMPVCDLGPKLVNQLCVSNQGLRDYTVDLVLDHFKNNPEAKAFPLNPMDGPSFWCECAECKRLDPPGLDWSKHRSDGHITGMADRALNYANEVADRVSKVYPDKLIEMYAYGYTLSPPVKEKAHKNVFIKYANLSGGRGTGPLGRSLLDPDAGIWGEWRKQLEGWKKAGATLAFYNYLEWEHPDVTLFWFYNTVDVLKNLNRHYNCRILAGETENNILVSTMLYNVLARTAWDVDTDYRQVIRDLCDKFYGPVANRMYDYNMLMDKGIRESTAWQEEEWRPNKHVDLSFEALEAGRALLEEAAADVRDDPKLTRRLALARFGHAYLTYVRALNEKHKTTQTEVVARRAFDTANALRSEHHLMTKLPSVQQLKTFYYPD